MCLADGDFVWMALVGKAPQSSLNCRGWPAVSQCLGVVAPMSDQVFAEKARPCCSTGAGALWWRGCSGGSADDLSGDLGGTAAILIVNTISKRRGRDEGQAAAYHICSGARRLLSWIGSDLILGRIEATQSP